MSQPSHSALFGKVYKTRVLSSFPDKDEEIVFNLLDGGITLSIVGWGSETGAEHLIIVYNRVLQNLYFYIARSYYQRDHTYTGVHSGFKVCGIIHISDINSVKNILRDYLKINFSITDNDLSQHHYVFNKPKNTYDYGGKHDYGHVDEPHGTMRKVVDSLMQMIQINETKQKSINSKIKLIEELKKTCKNSIKNSFLKSFPKSKSKSKRKNKSKKTLSTIPNTKKRNSMRHKSKMKSKMNAGMNAENN